MRPFRALLSSRPGRALGRVLLACAARLRLPRCRIRGGRSGPSQHAPVGNGDGPSLADVADNLPGLIYRHVLHGDGSTSCPFVAGHLPGVAFQGDSGPHDPGALMRRVGEAQAEAWRPLLDASPQAGTSFHLELPLGGRWLRSIAQLRHRAQRRGEGGIGDARAVWDGVVLDVTDLKQAEARLAASVVEKEALLSEVHHRVYNNLQIVWSLLKLESRDAGNDEARTRLDRVANLIAVLGRIHHQLYATRDFTRIDVAAELRRISEALAQEAGRPPLPVEAVELHCDMDTAVPFLLAACELVSAALDGAAVEPERGAAPGVRLTRGPEGEVHLTVRSAGKVSESLSALGRNLVAALCMQIDAVASFRHEGGHEGGEVASLSVPGQRFVD